jgi:hypothetical protein
MSISGPASVRFPRAPAAGQRSAPQVTGVLHRRLGGMRPGDTALAAHRARFPSAGMASANPAGEGSRRGGRVAWRDFRGRGSKAQPGEGRRNRQAKSTHGFRTYRTLLFLRRSARICATIARSEYRQRNNFNDLLGAAREDRTLDLSLTKGIRGICFQSFSRLRTRGARVAPGRAFAFFASDAGKKCW